MRAVTLSLAVLVAVLALAPNVRADVYDCRTVDAWAVPATVSSWHLPNGFTGSGTPAEQQSQGYAFRHWVTAINSCLALREVLVDLRQHASNTYYSVASADARLGRVDTDLDTVNARLSRVEAAVTGTLAVRVVNPGAAGDPTPAVEQARDLLRADFWMAMGLACALFFGTYLVRVVLPRA